MNKIYYFTFTIFILLNFDVWAKGGDGPNPKKDARIIKKQLKKNLKGGEANYVFDLRGDYYNTSFLSDENTTKFNDIADIFLQETGYQVSFINVQDYLMNGTESKEDLERIRDEYIRGLEENIPEDGVYFLLIPQTDVNLEGILETQFTFNVLIGAGVDITILNDFIKNRLLGNNEEEEVIEPDFIKVMQIVLLSQKFNNANLAISATIVVLETGKYLEKKFTNPGLPGGVVIIAFTEYEISLGDTNNTLVPGLGHAGILLFDDKGFTKYYEYGRYQTEQGEVRNYPVPNLSFDKEGNPTEESLTMVLKPISINSAEVFGKNGTIEAVYINSNGFEESNNLAQEIYEQNYNPERAPYSWVPMTANHCGTFAYDVADIASDINIPKQVPRSFQPNMMILYLQLFYRGINYNPNTSKAVYKNNLNWSIIHEFFTGRDYE